MPDTAPVATAPIAEVATPTTRARRRKESNLTTGQTQPVDTLTKLRGEVRTLLMTAIHSKGAEKAAAHRTFAMRCVRGDFAQLAGDRIGFATSSGSTISAPAADWVVFGCIGRLLSAGKVTDLI